MNASARSLLISVPDHKVTLSTNPQLVLCNSSSLLNEQSNIAVASTTSGNINMELPSGIKYLLGTVAKIAGTASLTITDNGGGANAPNHLMETNKFLGFQNLFNLKQLGYEKA
jgi:hypothetical protein